MASRSVSNASPATEGDAALVAVDEPGDLGRGGDRRAVGLVGRDEGAGRPVAGPEVAPGDLLDLLGGDLLEAVAAEEIQPPVAPRGPPAQLDRQPVRVGGLLLDVLEEVDLGPLDLLPVSGSSLTPSTTFKDHVADLGERPVLADVGRDLEDAGVVEDLGVRGDAGGQLGLDQGLIEPAGRGGDEGVGQDLQRGEVGVVPGGDVVHRAEDRHVADAPEGHRPLAVLGGLLGVGRPELAGRPRQGAEVLADQLERPGRVELAGDDEHGVVRLVILAVEGPEALDRDALDVGAAAVDRLAVVVPLVGDGHHPLVQDVRGPVLDRLELVADHRELGGQVLGLDVRVDQAVGLEPEGEVEVSRPWR